MSSAWDNNHGENSYTNGNKTEENHRWKTKTSKSNGCDEDHEEKEEKNVSNTVFLNFRHNFVLFLMVE